MKIQAGKEKVTIIPANPKRAEPGKPANQKLRVAAYCRVSSEKDEQLNSFAVQVSYYTEKINSKAEWKFAGVYADEGITGTSMKHREDFKRMLRACREGRIDLILCKSVSRFRAQQCGRAPHHPRPAREKYWGAVREGGRGYPHHEFGADPSVPLGLQPVRVRVYPGKRAARPAHGLRPGDSDHSLQHLRVLRGGKTEASPSTRNRPR